MGLHKSDDRALVFLTERAIGFLIGAVGCVAIRYLQMRSNISQRRTIIGKSAEELMLADNLSNLDELLKAIREKL